MADAPALAGVGQLLAGCAAAWTLGVWATVQEVGRRLRTRGALADSVTLTGSPKCCAGDGAWPALTCLCPLDGGDAADGFATVALGQATSTAAPGPGVTALAAAGTPNAAAGLLAYPGPLRVVFLADEVDLAATARARRHAERLRAHGFTAEARATRPRGRNRKAAQLADAGRASAPMPADTTLVLSLDSDVRPESVRVAELVALLCASPRLGAVWQPTAPAADGPSFGDWLASAVLGAGAQAVPVLAVLDGHSPIGKVLLYRAEAVDATGGWAAATDELGDDVGLGLRLRAAGLATAAAAGPPAHAPRRGQRGRDVARRLLRWIAVVRQQRPRLLWAYPLLLAHLPLLLGLWAVAVAAGAPPWLGGLGAATGVATRLQLGWLARRSCGHPVGGWRLLRDALAGDLALLALFLRSGVRPATYWNGRPVGDGPSQRRPR